MLELVVILWVFYLSIWMRGNEFKDEESIDIVQQRNSFISPK